MRGRPRECEEMAERFRDAYDIQGIIQRYRGIRVGDIVQMRHTTYEVKGQRHRVPFTSTVIYKDAKIITVQGDHYAEAYQLFDLIGELLEHIPC